METMDAVFTRAEYMQLPEGFPAQLIEGCLVKTPSPTYAHQFFIGRIYRMLEALVGERRVVMAPCDIPLDDLNVYQPAVVVWAEAPSMDIEQDDNPLPILAVEVLSPSTERRDRKVKTRRLLAAGVDEVWLVDPHRRRIEVMALRHPQEAIGGETVTSRVVPGFALSPEDLFSE